MSSVSRDLFCTERNAAGPPPSCPRPLPSIQSKGAWQSLCSLPRASAGRSVRRRVDTDLSKVDGSACLRTYEIHRSL